MRTLILNILLITSFSAVFSTEMKTYENLLWKEPVALDENATKKILYFDASTITDESLLPYYTKIVSINNNETIDSVSITNIVSVELTAKEKSLISGTRTVFPYKPKIKIDYTIDRKQSKAVISFIPIISSNGSIQKIISFDLTLNTKENPQLRSTTTTHLHQFATNSVLQSGKWIKVSVSESGIYKISYEDLVKWGIKDPANAHVFGYGGAQLPESFLKNKQDDLPQISVYKELGSDGIFNAGDYILFYAQGPISWTYNSSNNIFERTVNNYSFLGYYFISSDAGTDKTITTKALPTEETTKSVDNFLDYQLYEKETRNIMSSGKEWYGEQFSSTSEYTFPFTFNNIDTTKAATIVVNAIAKSSSSTTMSAFANGTLLGDLSFPKIPTEYDGATGYTGTYSYHPANSYVNLRLKYNNSSIGTAYLNYITINAYRKLSLASGTMCFRNPDIVKAGQFATYNINGTSGLKCWDITDPQNIESLSTTYDNGIYSFLDDAQSLREYVALYPNSDSYPHPTYVSTVENQNLHNLPQKDFIIISSPDFLTQANALAKKHEEVDSISTIVVTPEEIYNEFSSGTPDATAFRWFLKMFYDRAQTSADAPKYLLLFGDGTYDNRTITKANAAFNKLPTYQVANSLNEISSTVTDDYFGVLDDVDGASLAYNSLDIGIGRFPASTQEQADDLISKIFSYIDNAKKSYWKNLLCYIADDGDTMLHTRQSDDLATNIEKNYPQFQPKRIFLDAFYQQGSASGESYPTAKEKIFNMINSGTFLINYSGHGSTEGLANEKIISRSDISGMNNQHLPLFVTATCSFSRFDNSTTSTGEELFLKANGGAIGLFTTTRTVYASPNFDLNMSLNQYLLKLENNKPLALGEIMRRAKNQRLGDSNRLNFTLLADPALVLAIPRNTVVTDSILSNSNTGSDTIQALSTVTIKGEIQNNSGVKLTNFNGQIYAEVYDKKVAIKTLDNDHEGTTYTYVDRPAILFSGKTKVTNGEYSLTFMLPKDIGYNYGGGRINYYAYDDTLKQEAQGYFENFTIGGTKSDFTLEGNGPDINIYMNSPKFKSGNTIDASSVFYAELSDESGINTGGSGIGHDLLITLNNDANQSYIVNDFFETTLKDYRNGLVKFQMPTLADGSYSLRFRAWDLLNNSSEKTITFNVNSEKAPEVYQFYASPNPAKEYVKFVINHNQPLSSLDLNIQVLNLTGSLVWQTTSTVYSEDNTTEYTWDLKGADGSKLSNGLYLYRITLKSEKDGVLTSKTNRLIVK